MLSNFDVVAMDRFKSLFLVIALRSVNRHIYDFKLLEVFGLGERILNITFGISDGGECVGKVWIGFGVALIFLVYF
jgi:hypothetical protein